MTAVIDKLVGIWKQPREGTHPDAVPRNLSISTEEVLTTLASEFPVAQIAADVEKFLFGVIEAYDGGEIPYKQGTSVGMGLRSRAVLCAALVGETDKLNVSRHLLQELIRAFPTLEWHQTLRTIIEGRVDKADALYALAAGLHSKRAGQIHSSAIGLAYYAGYARNAGGSPQCIDHAILQICTRIDFLLGKPSLPPLFAVALKAGKRHAQTWR